MSLAERAVFKAVVAMNNHRVIGIGNRLPWHIPQDLQHFKALTLNRVLIMGHDTYKSIGKALPGRTTIVLTRDTQLLLPDALVANGKQHAEELALECLRYRGLKEVMVVGGSQIYRLFMDRISVIHQTIVHSDVQGEFLFPETPDFKVMSSKKKITEGKNHHGQHQVFHLCYKTLARKQRS